MLKRPTYLSVSKLHLHSVWPQHPFLCSFRLILSLFCPLYSINPISPRSIYLGSQEQPVLNLSVGLDLLGGSTESFYLDDKSTSDSWWFGFKWVPLGSLSLAGGGMLLLSNCNLEGKLKNLGIEALREMLRFRTIPVSWSACSSHLPVPDCKSLDWIYVAIQLWPPFCSAKWPRLCWLHVLWSVDTRDHLDLFYILNRYWLACIFRRSEFSQDS